MPTTNDSNARDPNLAGWLAVEAERLAAAGRLGESERMLGRLLELQEKAIAAGELDLAETLGMRGEVRFLANDLTGAEADFRRALAIRERGLGGRHLTTASSLCSLALVLVRRGERAKAEPLLSRCLEIRRMLLGEDHPETLRAQAHLRRLWHELSGTEDDMCASPQDDQETWAGLYGSPVVAEWSSLRDRFGALSRRLLDAARADRTTPPDQLVSELADCRLGFQRLCDEARGWAEAFQVPCPPDSQLENLFGIASFLDLIGAAVLNEERTERPRRQALLVIDQVLRLAHAREPGFRPLIACQECAQALLGQLGTGVEARVVRPFYDLLVLAHQRNTVSDDAWLRLHQSVAGSFGKALAAAATRGHLVPALAAVPSMDSGRFEQPMAAVLNPAFARPDDEYVIPLATAPVLRAVPLPPVIGGPLSMAPRELSGARHATGAAVRFRTGDGKLYTLMPAEPVAGPKAMDRAGPSFVRGQGAASES